MAPPIWSAQQDAALVAIGRWLREPSGPQVFRLAGPAGSGKTLLAKYALEDALGDVYWLAPTGKAADVLTRKGCPATTIHSKAYLPKGEKRSARADEIRGEIDRLKKLPPTPEREARLAVLKKTLREASRNDGPVFQLDEASVLGKAETAAIGIDEGSMVADNIGVDLLSFNKKILVIYDPHQLPPVKGPGMWTSGRPDFYLTEIHRQAAESGIIQLATAVRNGQPVRLGAYEGDCLVVSQTDTDYDHKSAAMEADQVICGTNETRGKMNHRMRTLRGLTSPHPQVGDRVICLRNEYDHEPTLYNGSVWNVTRAEEADVEDMSIWLEVDSADVPGLNAWVRSHLHYFHGLDDIPAYRVRDASQFDFASAITCHKSQGSQWDSVYVFDESAKAFGGAARQHLYTAITRAAKRLVVAVP